MSDLLETTPFATHVKALQDWLVNTASSNAKLSSAREWCTLGIEDLTQEGLRTFFDRSAINADFEDAYGKVGEKGVPYAFLQHEADLIYSLHKGMVARHKGRMMHYKDDCTQKSHRVYSALSIGLAKYELTKESAEKLV